jgi:hypothetical protein
VCWELVEVTGATETLGVRGCTGPLRQSVEVRRRIQHNALIVGTKVEPANVVTKMTIMLGFFACAKTGGDAAKPKTTKSAATP